MKPPRPFTPRQQQVVDAIGRGLTFARMERELGVSAGRARNIARDAAKKVNNPLGLTPKALLTLYVRWTAKKAG
jgi:DNA-binding NarL/FixJ family response regulator